MDQSLKSNIARAALLAIVAAAAPVAALAQSSVDIYGRMDLGMLSQDITVGHGINASTFSLAGAQNTRTDSRLGFRGTEDLGGGLRAGLVYEIGINADRTATGNAQTRLANLSLTGGFGTVVVGTFDNAFFAVRDFSPATAGMPGGNSTQIGGGCGEHFCSRSQNAIAYVSPTFNGFTLSAAAAREDNTLVAAHDLRSVVLGVGYSQGPWAAHVAFGEQRADNNATGARAADLRNWALGVRYTLPQVALSFIYEDTKQSLNRATAREQTAWEIGARFPVGAFTPYVTFGQGEITAAGAASDTSAWQIGTTYNLSTRTSIYAAFGEDRIETAAGLNVRKRDGFALGIVHTF